MLLVSSTSSQYFVTGFRMSAYEEIRNQLSKEDKNGFSLWKKVVAGMLAGGEEIKNCKPGIIKVLRSWTADGLPHRPDQDTNTDGGEEEAHGEAAQGGGDDRCGQVKETACCSIFSQLNKF